MPSNSNILPYSIKYGDTIQSIAKAIIGNAKRWHEIVFFNQLTYPYIDESGRHFGKAATGQVDFSIDVDLSPALFIPKGTIVRTVPKRQYGYDLVTTKRYTTTQDALLGAGRYTVTVPVQAMGYGEVGNVPEGFIKEVETTLMYAGVTPVAFNVTVINNSEITGGLTEKVLTVGDVLLVPQGTGRVVNTLQEQSPLEILLGTDLLLGGEGDAKPTDLLNRDNFDNDLALAYSTISTGFRKIDLMQVSGLANLMQAVRHRLMTEKGELTYHPSYGSLLPTLIGKGGTNANVKMMEIETTACILEDPRIVAVDGVYIEKVDIGIYRINFIARIINVNVPVQGNVIADFRS